MISPYRGMLCYHKITSRFANYSKVKFAHFLFKRLLQLLFPLINFCLRKQGNENFKFFRKKSSNLLKNIFEKYFTYHFNYKTNTYISFRFS